MKNQTSPPKEDTTEIVAENDAHKYFTQIPNIVDESNISDRAFRLYFKILRLLWKYDKCEYGTRKLAKMLGISHTTLADAKDELEYAGLIRIEEWLDEFQNRRHRITVVDIWETNMQYFKYKVYEEIEQLDELVPPQEEKKEDENNNKWGGVRPVLHGVKFQAQGVRNQDRIKILVKIKKDRLQKTLQTESQVNSESLDRSEKQESPVTSESSHLPKNDDKEKSSGNTRIGVEPLIFIDYEKMIDDCPHDLSKHDSVDWFYQRLQYSLGDKAYEKAVELYRQKVGETVREKHDADTQRERYIQSMNNGAVTIDQVKADLCAKLGMDYSFYGKYTQDRLHKLVDRVRAGETIEQFKQWWNTHDWRGKDGQPPTLENVFTYWPQAFQGSVVQPRVTIAADGGAYV